MTKQGQQSTKFSANGIESTGEPGAMESGGPGSSSDPNTYELGDIGQLTSVSFRPLRL